MVYVVLAVEHPNIFVDFLTLENRKVAQPNGHGFGNFIVADLLFFFGKGGELLRFVVVVLAAKCLVGVVEPHAIFQKGMVAILQLDVHEAVVLRRDPHVKLHGFIAGHVNVDVLFEFVSEIDDFVVMVEFEQAIKHIADGVLVIHQGTERRRIIWNKVFHAVGILDNVRFCWFGFLFAFRHRFFLFSRGLYIFNTLLTPTASAAAFGHRKMQAFFCDTHFARFFDRFVQDFFVKKI